MGAGHHGFLTGDVDIHDALVDAAGIRRELRIHVRTPVSVAVGEGVLIAGEEAHLAAGFDGHVGHGETAFHGKIVDDGAAEFERLVAGAVHADPVNQDEHEILGAQVLIGRAGDVHADGRRNLEPGFAEGHASSEIRGAHARGEGADAAVGAGM